MSHHVVIKNNIKVCQKILANEMNEWRQPVQLDKYTLADSFQLYPRASFYSASGVIKIVEIPSLLSMAT